MAVTVRRHESGAGWHEMAARTPHPLLNGAVLRYAGYIERTSLPVRRLETPFGGVVMILSFGKALRIVDAVGEDRAHRSFAGGICDGPTYTEHDGDQHGVQIDLTPLAARALFGLPLSELTNRVLELDQLLGRDADQLLERLYDAGTWEQRFALLDAVLMHRMAQAKSSDLAVVEAYMRLRKSHGSIEIGDLCRQIGWSKRHLATRFREQVGLTPKIYARVLRFERATALLRRDGGSCLAEVALECGYYDQAGAGAAAEVNFVQDRSRVAA